MRENSWHPSTARSRSSSSFSRLAKGSSGRLAKGILARESTCRGQRGVQMPTVLALGRWVWRPNTRYPGCTKRASAEPRQLTMESGDHTADGGLGKSENLEVGLHLTAPLRSSPGFQQTVREGGCCTRPPAYAVRLQPPSTGRGCKPKQNFLR